MKVYITDLHLSFKNKKKISIKNIQITTKIIWKDTISSLTACGTLFSKGLGIGQLL